MKQFSAMASRVSEEETMKIYRICTEAKNVEEIERATAVLFEGFSIWQGAGFWRGTREQSLMIEIFSSELNAGALVRSLAQTIRDFNKQECVLVQTIECEGVFI